MRYSKIASSVMLGAFLTFGCLTTGTPWANAQPVSPPRKLALLVGVSDYEQKRATPPAWWNLNCKPDLDAMKQVLMERFGFLPADILVISDRQATRAGIVNAWQKHLVAQARPGDIVAFHYSGHGQQVKDDNGDELDGLDETLVPFDYISQSAEDGAKSNLRDDQLGEMLGALKAKMLGSDGRINGNITLTFDCCFSGTATRGTPERGRLRERGRGWNSQLDGPKPGFNARGNSAGSATDEASSSGLFTPDAALAQGYIVLSATQSDQTAKEAEDEKGRAMGAFTLHFTRALSRATPGTTYRDLFERLNLDLKLAVSDQDPHIEGEINKKLFADATLPAPEYFVLQASRGDSVMLPLGSLHGATVGSRFDLFKAGSSVSVPQNKIGQVEITAVNFTQSTAVLGEAFRGKLKPEDFKAARAVKTHHNFGDNKLRVLLEGEGAWKEATQNLEILTTQTVTPENYDLKIFNFGEDLVVERKDGTRLTQVANTEQAKALLHEALLGEWRWQFLSRLRNDDPAATVRVHARLVAVEVETDETNRVRRVLRDQQQSFERGGRLRFPEDTYVMLELRNSSRVPAYVTVLDLAADGSIDPIFPHPEAVGVQENRIPADNTWHRIAGPRERPFVFRLGAPYGTEIFKVIATKQQTDFSSLAYQKAVTERGRDNLLSSLDPSAWPLGRLLLSATTGSLGSQSTRGASFSGVPPTTWNSSDIVFEVLPLE